MPDLDLIKQVEQGVRDRRGRFARGPLRGAVHRPERFALASRRAEQAPTLTLLRFLAEEGMEGHMSGVDASLGPIKFPFSYSTVHPIAAFGRVRSDRGEDVRPCRFLAEAGGPGG